MNKRISLLFIFIVVFLLLSSCSEKSSSTTSSSETQTSLCGDGSCDAMEAKLGKCPDDCGSAAIESSTVSSASSQDHPMATVVVSSNLIGGGDCHDHYIEGCDLIRARVDLTTGAVSDVNPLVTDSGADEFPVLFLDQKNVFYTHSDETKESALVIPLLGGESNLLSDFANHPFPTSDGETVYLVLTTGFFLGSLSLTDPDASVQKITSVSGIHEPHVSSNGFVSLYRLTAGENRGSRTAQALIYNPSTDQTIDVSSADGTAHCYWNFDSSKLYCNNRDKGGVLAYTVLSDGTIGEPSVVISFPSPPILASIDKEFADDCVSTSLEYGSFCDADHLLLTAACMSPINGTLTQTFTQTVILNIKTNQFLPLGYNIAAAYGKSGTTWTGTCVAD